MMVRREGKVGPTNQQAFPGGEGLHPTQPLQEVDSTEELVFRSLSAYGCQEHQVMYGGRPESTWKARLLSDLFKLPMFQD